MAAHMRVHRVRICGAARAVSFVEFEGNTRLCVVTFGNLAKKRLRGGQCGAPIHGVKVLRTLLESLFGEREATRNGARRGILDGADFEKILARPKEEGAARGG